MDFKGKTFQPNPYAKSNPISKILFLWVFPLFRKGYKKELEEDDLYIVLKNDKTQHVGDKLERFWNDEKEKAKLTGKKPSLYRALFKTSWKSFLIVIILITFNQCVNIVAQPIFLRLLIQYFNNNDETEKWKGYVYAGAICLISFLHTLITQPSVFMMMHTSMKMRVATTALIYRKTLSLSKAAQQETNAGHIINLLSNDCTRFDINFNFLPYILVAPIQVSLLMYLMYDQIGPACFAGVAFIILLLPMQYYLGKYSGVFRLKTAQRTDERGRFMNEIIVGIRVIKMYAWEKPFSRLIDGLRKLEVIQVRKAGMLRGLHHAVFTFAPKLVQYLTFVAFVLVEDEPMTAEKVFFTLTCLHTMIQITIHFLPLSFAGLGEVFVAIRRIEEFLLLNEQKNNNYLLEYDPPKTHTESQMKVANDLSNTKEIIPTETDNQINTTSKISMKNVCASWSQDAARPTLDNVTFSIDTDKLVMVVGPVGSSKTSLLHTLIDELPISSGHLSVRGTVSYASQEAWIFAGNVRQNIIFGLPYEEPRYKKTIKACALEEDLKQFPFGDMTVVGERGIALSGGQRARVNLARAIYRKSDIYILDDPLAAVDTRVSRHLFEKCVKEHLQGSVRILVTHQLQYLPQADYILVLNHGKILAQGSFKELIDSGIDFEGLIQSTNDNESGEDSASARAKRQSIISTAGEEKVNEEEKPEENAEKKVVGSVTARTYKDYFMAGHSLFDFLLLMLTFFLCQLFTSGNDYWLSYWTNAEARRIDYLERNNLTAEECSGVDDKACDDPENAYLGENVYLYVYTGFVVAVTLFNFCRGLWFYLYCAKISVNVHDRMFRSIVRAPTKFFDDNPSGRIMNRFTKDVGSIDELLPPTMIDTLTIFLQILGVIGVVIASNYYLSVPTVVLFVVLYILRKVFIETARDVKRIESITRSPLFTHVSATIQGLTTIRACKSQNILIQQFEGHQDTHSSAWFLFLGANRCFGIWLELISNVFLVLVAFSFLLISSSNEGGNVGLAISSILTMMGTFQWGMRQSAETENHMTSVERALEYSKLSPEAETESKPDMKPPPEWPHQGQIEFHEVDLFYEEDKPVLKDLTFEIRPSEKIGIVGRTGAGKSSIIAALFRLTEPRGNMYIDGVKVNDIGLNYRKFISIIPQDPVLFGSSVRFNLDPFDQFQDIGRVISPCVSAVELLEQVTIVSSLTDFYQN